jgi:hypothetical protein
LGLRFATFKKPTVPGTGIVGVAFLKCLLKASDPIKWLILLLIAKAGLWVRIAFNPDTAF